MSASFSPKEIVDELDIHVVGQKAAKRAVAIALRNRFRRAKLDPELRDEVSPKNILMIGPTGVGKTEIARRIAKLTGAPFVKVEATKFTEVGYVGRDVDSMVRDLVETGIRTLKAERISAVEDRAKDAVNERILDAMMPDSNRERTFRNPLEALFQASEPTKPASESVRLERDRLRRELLTGALDDRVIEINVEDTSSPNLDFMPGMGAENLGNLQEMLGNFFPKRKRQRRVTVHEAKKLLVAEEAQKLIDMDELTRDAVRRAEEAGIIFIDEIDKIASREGRGGADVSREGVQRDILPIVEGSTVMTKHGPVKTDHILFIAAGAFHMSKPSDLIPELQGRFPIRVELTSLSANDMEKILTEPKSALITQYKALLATEGVTLEFAEGSVRRIAEIATDVNANTEDIGARRLHTLLEKLLEDVMFEAPNISPTSIVVTPDYVDEKLAGIAGDRDLSHFIL
ncbi:ATP-dependent protease ATPase subunit HslU [Ferroacidibacillus organovorans]|uniref:ATP-dependent protease ATPase subunit HslU n=1 Tax=Ferroacidibacillus organovorans TaxID=1765683 RepID=A0A162UYD5_9BACL|nr:ATP-dependent protease ATPase subunit HslU [Ferroacidibacillus organovorans]KYP82146.1 HslU--HslV peptidase ATPase subunit [Ferroacidibacillus organovorans]OAG94429.1 Clp protease [Ferroacidibacillus organovorans]OPG15685.1 HslU--HslV peptidase ATPase subunit [Ferroacidibacillus organovorans]